MTDMIKPAASYALGVDYREKLEFLKDVKRIRCGVFVRLRI